MVKEINKDEFLLSLKAEPLKIDEIYMLEDLKDTLIKNKDICVGMALNMIGYIKSGIAFYSNDEVILMANPKIIDKREEYKTKEGCLSLTGLRDCIRHKKIKVEYYNIEFKKRIKSFKDFEAEIIEHEIDHLNGIII